MDGVTLGGRAFQIITNGPVKHDFWMAARVREAGVDRVHLAPGQPVGVVVDALLDQLMTSGQSLVLLGGMLAPAELALRDWTPEVAADATAHIESLMAPADKQRVRGMVAQVLAGFFASGLASLTTSPTSSPTATSAATAATARRDVELDEPTMQPTMSRV